MRLAGVKQNNGKRGYLEEPKGTLRKVHKTRDKST